MQGETCPTIISQTNINHWLCTLSFHCVTVESRQSFHKVPYVRPLKDMHLNKGAQQQTESVSFIGCQELCFPIKHAKEQQIYDESMSDIPNADKDPQLYINY